MLADAPLLLATCGLPDTDADAHRCTVDRKRRPHRTTDARREKVGVRCGAPRAEYRELGASDARNEVCSTHATPQSIGDFAQQCVASSITETIVHCLEVVEIARQNRAVQRAVEGTKERFPIGELRELVVVGREVEPQQMIGPARRTA